MITLSDALKATRRGAYKYSDAWRTLIIVQHPRQLAVLWDEVKSLMDASSMSIESAKYITRTMQIGKGAIVRFAAVNDAMDAYTLAGHQYTHIIMLYDLPANVDSYVRSFLRSLNVPDDDLRIDRAEW